MYEAELDHHVAQQDHIDEFTFCVACGAIIYLHDRATYECVPDGVICKRCAKAQQAADWFNERVANGVDPIEAARDADASVMTFEEWQEHWTVRDGQVGVL